MGLTQFKIYSFGNEATPILTRVVDVMNAVAAERIASVTFSVAEEAESAGRIHGRAVGLAGTGAKCSIGGFF